MLSASGPAHQGDEACLLGRIVAEESGELGRDGRAPGFSTPRNDIHMCSASSITATPRGLSTSSIAVMICEFMMLLRLQPARIDVDQPRELGKSDHPLDRQVGDMRPAEERHDVVLAMRIERDVAHQHEIVVGADLGERAVEHLDRAFVIAAEQFVIGGDDAARRVEQTTLRTRQIGIDYAAVLGACIGRLNSRGYHVALIPQSHARMHPVATTTMRSRANLGVVARVVH